MVQNLVDYANGKKDEKQLLMSTFSPGMATEAAELAFNTDFYTGQHIWQPDDLREGKLGHVGFDISRSILSQVSPAQDIAQVAEGKTDWTRTLENQLMVNDPTERQLEGQKTGEKIAKRQQKTADKKRPNWVP